MSNLQDASRLWQQVVDSWDSHNEACRLFLHGCEPSDRIAVVKSACLEPRTEAAALMIISRMKETERLQLLCPLLQLFMEANIYSYPRPDEVILSLPRASVAAGIGECLEAIKKKQDHDELEMLMLFLQRFDRGLALSLAHELANSDQQNIRALGETCLTEIAQEHLGNTLS
jgi:hypothetical protein